MNKQNSSKYSLQYIDSVIERIFWWKKKVIEILQIQYNFRKYNSFDLQENKTTIQPTEQEIDNFIIQNLEKNSNRSNYQNDFIDVLNNKIKLWELYISLIHWVTDEELIKLSNEFEDFNLWYDTNEISNLLNKLYILRKEYQNSLERNIYWDTSNVFESLSYIYNTNKNSIQEWIWQENIEKIDIVFQNQFYSLNILSKLLNTDEKILLQKYELYKETEK